MRRRSFLSQSLALGIAAPALPARADDTIVTRPFPKSGLRVPVVGMGTWLTFHVDVRDVAAMARRAAVLERFFAGGGALIDSSPMYASAEEVLGELLPDALARARERRLFCATKVWTPLGRYGPTQMRRSLALWKQPRADLMQVHNLLNWREHLKTLRAWKDEGRTRLIGVTTSHGNKHDELATVLRSEGAALDALQITCNPADRRAEPLMRRAADLGLAVIVNRPFDGGTVPDRLARTPLPGLAAELGCRSWAAAVLKWQLADPTVTCVIPATTDPVHMDENMSAQRGALPDRRERDALGAAIVRALA
jgi:diketogulonate reductase-like aldo/keto reductase